MELLTTCMNNYFTRAINMIMAFEGDVIKFAGDSMIVLFYPSEVERRHADRGLRACTLRMTACAHQLATRLGHMRMKMNGQVEPAPPPPPEPAAAPVAAGPSGQLAPAPSGGMAGLAMAVSGELGEAGGDAGGQADMLRNNSAPASGTLAQRRMGVTGQHSPRSSTTNPTLGAAGATDEGSPSTADAGRVPDGMELPTGGIGRKRGKSWSLMAKNLLKAGAKAAARFSEANMTPGRRGCALGA